MGLGGSRPGFPWPVATFTSPLFVNGTVRAQLMLSFEKDMEVVGPRLAFWPRTGRPGPRCISAYLLPPQPPPEQTPQSISPGDVPSRGLSKSQRILWALALATRRGQTASLLQLQLAPWLSE